jgi:hypothetical protein
VETHREEELMISQVVTQTGKHEFKEIVIEFSKEIMEKS